MNSAVLFAEIFSLYPVLMSIRCHLLYTRITLTHALGKRPRFGARKLNDPEKVFSQNAWFNTLYYTLYIHI